jgi:hypothetical protein
MILDSMTLGSILFKEIKLLNSEKFLRVKSLLRACMNSRVLREIANNMSSLMNALKVKIISLFKV